MLDHITQSAAFVHRLASAALTVKIELENIRPARNKYAHIVAINRWVLVTTFARISSNLRFEYSKNILIETPVDPLVDQRLFTREAISMEITIRRSISENNFAATYL